jgi:hypothetical protein
MFETLHVWKYFSFILDCYFGNVQNSLKLKGFTFTPVSWPLVKVQFHPLHWVSGKSVQSENLSFGTEKLSWTISVRISHLFSGILIIFQMLDLQNWFVLIFLSFLLILVVFLLLCGYFPQLRSSNSPIAFYFSGP